MELQEILSKRKKEIDEISKNSWNTFNSEDNTFNELGKEKLKALKENIFEIKKLIEEREGLSRELSKEAEKIKIEINNHLMKIESSEDLKNDPDIQREVSGLRGKKVEVEEFQLNEKITCWKDVALLKKELRDREKELKEKEDRINAIERILK